MGKASDDCPFSKYRGEPATRKLDIAYEIPEKELKRLLAHHRECLKKRESSILEMQDTIVHSKNNPSFNNSSL